MKFILMLWIGTGWSGVTFVAEFDSQKACELAAVQVKMQHGALGLRSFHVCAAK